MSRYAAYYRAMERAMLAKVEAFKLDPDYDNDENKRKDHIDSYENMAATYRGLAKKSEEHA